MSSLTVEEDQRWVPTHVQVTVLRGRGLRGKGKHGTSDVYTIIQLGKEKYSTCVAEKTTEPEWREECSFELQPGVLERTAGRSAYPAACNELVLTVMHRALMGLDVFLGQAVIQLDKVFHESRCVKNEWYRLNSKTGKKEKERGDIQVTVQFTRNNLTASMYDLVMKDKGASTFSKLKERMRGKRRSSDEDSSSAILPGGYGSLYRMRQRLPSDGGGEEDYEDDEGGEARRSKMRTFFLRGKLRKSSDTRSSTSLGSESSESSSRGGSLSPTAGISVVVSDLSNSPSNSSNLTADNSPEHTANTSPKSSSLKCEFGDEAGEITIAVPQPTVCVNGSHAYDVQPLDPGSGKPSGSLGLGLLQKSLPLSMSLQNLNPRASSDLPGGPAGDGRRWSFDKPGEEEKAAIAAALEKSGPMVVEEDAGEAAPAEAASSSSASSEPEVQGKKQRRNLFSHGRNESAGKAQPKDESEQAPAAAEEKHKGWFGSKDSHSKLSPVVSPTLEPSTDPHPPPPPPTRHPSGSPVEAASSLHHTNPFCPSQTSPPPISPCNPFFSLLQHNPFYEDMLTTQQLNPPLPPLPFLSSSRPPIARLFPAEDSIADSNSRAMAKVWERPLPPAPIEAKKPLVKKSSNPFMSVEVNSEWDESFEAFAAGRLQSPEDLTTDCKTQQNRASDHQLERCNNKGAFLPRTDQNTNVNGVLHHQDWTGDFSEAHKSTSQMKTAHHLDTFPQFLETIPEHRSFETTLDTSTNSLACTETKQDSTNDFTNTHQTQPSVQPNSSSPDPSSSGLGSSVEEDFLSCLSSHSDKFSASSSSEEAESNILGFEKFSESAARKNERPSECEDDVADRSNDLTLVDDAQKTADLSGLERTLAPRSAEISHLPPDETRTEAADIQTLNISSILHPDLSLKLPETQPNSDESREKSLNDELSSTPPPSLHITTSSPGVKKQQDSPLSNDFLSISQILNTSGQDGTLISDQSSSSFLQSLYVSTDSQGYQTCESRPASVEPSETLHSANSTLCGELSVIRTASGVAAGPLDSTDAACSGENSQTETHVGEGVATNQHGVLADAKCPQALNATLHRSHSEGSLAPAFNELLTSFGSDPGELQEPSSSDLPSLTSSAPSLTPQSSPVALSVLPPFASARSQPPQAAEPMPQEAEQQAANQQHSPHLVKPLTTAMPAEEKRSVLATGLEKLKSTINPGRSSQISEHETERKKSLTEGAGSYYHLTHSELVALLVQREAELERQKAEFERQKLLLAKREVELRRLKPQVKDLEDYIDTLLVRIMEQKPTLLQVRSKFK
uniref:RAB11 family interacting protein 5 n=1 Tax=Amphiprion percula TaxID=161767 RepID=A0A3P8S789_AMPPE